jgi:Bacterial DNA polymerase III alpha subunit finger domain
MRPDGFEDISAVLALYRPGPMGAGSHTNYALRKNGLRADTPAPRPPANVSFAPNRSASLSAASRRTAASRSTGPTAQEPYPAQQPQTGRPGQIHGESVASHVTSSRTTR